MINNLTLKSSPEQLICLWNYFYTKEVTLKEALHRMMLKALRFNLMHPPGMTSEHISDFFLIFFLMTKARTSEEIHGPPHYLAFR